MASEDMPRRKRPLDNHNATFATQLQFVIIGGGIAAISCARELCALVGPNISLTLIAASSVLREVEVNEYAHSYYIGILIIIYNEHM